MKFVKIKKEIIDAISRERTYQDIKWGTLDEHPHEIPSWLLIMQNAINKAGTKWLRDGDFEAQEEILQVVATGVACLEQHGVVERKNIREFLENLTITLDDEKEV